MQSTSAGRELINKYLKENNITVASLAATFGLGKMYLSEVLSGKKNNTRGE